ncbi:MFS transporter [Alicyclobacillus mengziensis]|uniref:MFS transporter n=1 Tax=Alicyclobacillus mengziensis TaxID=2931921 RepID=A0A9X7VZN5_9BACL|nr:MFS transporter [Alicyclobacillus mengziensis]QSO47565.1 MFS transporter [Alicyclobacillus mengziensis]
MSKNQTVVDALNEAPLGLFHLRAVVTAGLGFFTDAYDLFIIGAALALMKTQWHLSSTEVGWVGSATLISTFIGAFLFGRLADVYGRKKLYGWEASIMAVGAILSAFSPNVIWLIVFRVLMGIGIGGDYPTSAVIMSEFSNTKDRGKTVGMVFSMQALGTIVGPVVAIALIGAGVPSNIAWRLMLGLGAIPALFVIYLRRTLPESPRYLAQVQGREEDAAKSIRQYSNGLVAVEGHSSKVERLTFGRFITTPKYLLMLLGTAGTWFVFDYAYYGNTISTNAILKLVSPHMSLLQSESLSLIIFAIAAVPGYVLAFLSMDKIGHKRLQLIGFSLMGLMFLLIGVVPGVASHVVPFMVMYGISYFFAEFGPNTTTFVMAAELYPVSMRTTGHGMSAGIAKIGAFIGVFIFPILSHALGLRGTLDITFAFSMVGMLLTLVLPEPARKSMESLSHQSDTASTHLKSASTTSA